LNTTFYVLAFGSDCENQQNVKSPSQCAAVADPPMKYDSKLAAELAKWSSLAYIDPGSYDNSSIQSTVTTQFDGRYEVLIWESLNVTQSLGSPNRALV